MGTVLSGAKYLALAAILTLASNIVVADNKEVFFFRLPEHPDFAEMLNITDPELDRYVTYDFGQELRGAALTRIFYKDGTIYKAYIARLARQRDGKVDLSFVVDTECEASEQSSISDFTIADQTIVARVFCWTGNYKLYVPEGDAGLRFVLNEFMTSEEFVVFESAEATVLFSNRNFRETYESLKNAL